MNVERKEGFTQVCVWPATIVGPDKIAEFEQFMLDIMSVRVQYLEEIKTAPDHNDPSSGGRNDLFFAIHQDDIAAFAVPRLQYGIHWVEDVLDNEYRRNMVSSPRVLCHSIYPSRIGDYRTW